MIVTWLYKEATTNRKIDGVNLSNQINKSGKLDLSSNQYYINRTQGCGLVANEVVETHEVLGPNPSGEKTLGDSFHLSQPWLTGLPSALLVGGGRYPVELVEHGHPNKIKNNNQYFLDKFVPI